MADHSTPHQLTDFLSLDGTSAEDVCDVIWLWKLHINVSPPSDNVHSVATNRTADSSTDREEESTGKKNEIEPPVSSDKSEPNSGEDEEPEPLRSPQPPLTVPIYPNSSQSGLGQPGRNIPIRGASAYSRELELMRALRPLRVRRPDPRHLELDEEATVECISQTGIWTPIMRACPSRWLDLTLVVEQSPTMRMWQNASHKLAQDLQRGCAPRRFNTLTLETTKDGSVGILGPSGRRASSLSGSHVVFFSDALSFGWLQGTIPTLLWRWQKCSTVVLLQPLPPLLWKRTTLRKQLPVPLAQARHESRHPLPIASMDPLHVLNLATTLAGRSQRPVAALLGPPEVFRPKSPVVISDIPFDPRTLTSNQINQVRQEFVETASPEARVLAAYLASVPEGWLQLPIMQLIQRQLVSNAVPWSLAEIFMSGLLYRVQQSPPKEGLSSPKSSETDITYDFIPSLREYFREKAALQRQIEIRLLISHYISGPQRSADLVTGQVQCTTPAESNANIATSAEPFADLPIYRLPSFETESLNVQPNSPSNLQSASADFAPSTRPLNEAKLILLGRGNSGKSSLRDLLVHGTFDQNKAETPGIDIQPWELNCHGKDLRIHVWDFGGQEITHATHQFFLTERSVYLLILEGRTDNQDRDAEYWLRLISTFGKDSPIIVVLNQWDERPFDVDRHHLQECYPSIKAFIPTDSKTRRGIDVLRGQICDVLRDLKEVHEPFPSSWWSVKDYFGTAAHNYLPFAQFRTICDSKGVKDAHEQDSLARMLHALGIILHNGEDERLKDTTVLNPRWVTNGVYRLLRLKDKKGQNTDGILTLAEACAALPEDPTHMVRYLIELMHRFELCYALDDAETRWLIPQVLTRYQPKLASDWTSAPATRLRYTYKVIPEGLLPRFIVRTHPLSEGQERWRSGVVLALNDAQALVKAESSENRVAVIVRGRDTDRLRLVQLIRGHLQDIHNSLSSLKPREEVEVAGHPDTYAEVGLLETDERQRLSTTILTAKGSVSIEQAPQLDAISSSIMRREPGPEPVRIFISYSQRDIRHLDVFKQNLKVMQMNGLITVWYDGLIKTGSEWDQDIRRELEEADIIVLMVSTNFLASDYIRGAEMARAIQRKEAGEAELVTLLLEPDCAWRVRHQLKLSGTGQTITINLAKYQAIFPVKNRTRRWPVAPGAFNHVEKALTVLRENILAKRKADLQEPELNQPALPYRKIYLSCVSREFGELLIQLRRHLTAAGMEVKTQENFPLKNADTLEKLESWIVTCDAIIHILGDQSGALAHPQAIARFLKARPDFLSTQPALREALDDFSDVTYTQWEVFIAIHHNRPVLLYQLPSAQPTHLTRLKLGGRYGSEFHSETDLLGKLIGDLQNIVPNTPTRFVSNIPASIGDHFVGRGSVLSTLHRRLFRSDIPHVSPPQVIRGLAGIGKTRVAIEYAHRFAESYVTRLFIRADSPASLHHNFANLTAPHLLNLPEYNEPTEEARARAVHQWLNSHSGWLLILDNVDTEENARALEQLLSKLATGHVIVTSRLSNWSSQVALFDLDVLGDGDAAQFLLHRTANKRVSTRSDVVDAKVLARMLDGLALALEQVAAYISEKHISFAEYVRRFEEQPTEVLRWHNPRTSQYPTSLAATFLSSFGRLCATARDLLDTLSYFSPDPIPRTLIRGIELEKALKELSTFSLIRLEVTPPDTFSMHRLIQETAKSATSDTQSRQAKKRATNLLASAVPLPGRDPSTWPEWRLLAPHCKHLCATTLPDAQSPEAATILTSYASYLLHYAADYSTAEKLCQRALAARQELLGRYHPDTLSSAANLADILAAQSRFEEATHLSKDTWKTRIRIFGQDHPDTLTSADHYAQLLYLQGDVAEAAVIFELTLKAREKVFPPNDQDTLASASDLGMAYMKLGKTKEAEALLRRAVDGTMLTLGNKHPAALVSLENLALLLEDQGKYEDAKNLRDQILERTSQIFGPTHPNTLTSHHNRGHLHQCKKEYEEARKHYLFVIDRRRETLGPEHPLTLLSEHKLATTYQDQACFALALAIYDRISPIADRVLGADNSDAALYRRQRQSCRSKLAL